MNDMEKLLDRMEKFKTIQDRQSDTIKTLSRANAALQGEVTALSFFAHSVAMSHQDMQYLLMDFQKVMEGVQGDPSQANTLQTMTSLQQRLVQAAFEGPSSGGPPS
jgi:hypothetical protein